MQSSKRVVSRIRQDEDRKNVFKPEPQEGSGLATEARQRLCGPQWMWWSGGQVLGLCLSRVPKQWVGCEPGKEDV